MKVKELMELLKDLDQETKIVFTAKVYDPVWEKFARISDRRKDLGFYELQIFNTKERMLEEDEEDKPLTEEEHEELHRHVIGLNDAIIGTKTECDDCKHQKRGCEGFYYCGTNLEYFNTNEAWKCYAFEGKGE